MNNKQIKKALENVYNELNEKIKMSEVEDGIAILGRMQIAMGRLAGIIDMIEEENK